MKKLLIYGAYGYTGTLTAHLAKERGVDVVLAGRNADKLNGLAAPLGFEARAFEVDEIAAHLDGVGAVLHCAGPFSSTVGPVLQACLDHRVHYLDITGEIEVFEAVAARDAEAKAAGIVAMPGVGFDVVPTDCLAAYVCGQVPEATELVLAFANDGGMSRGTAATMAESVGLPGKIRKNGQIIDVPPIHETRVLDFGAGGQRTCGAIPWGDVSTAFYTTGVGNIMTMMAMPLGMRLGAQASGLLGGLLQTKGVQRWLNAKIREKISGPSESRRKRTVTYVWGEARAENGRSATARLVTPEGYTLTADSSLRIAAKVLAGDVESGFWTPARAFGADFVLECDGVTREDV